MLAQTKVEKCPCCQRTNIVKNGFTRHTNQRVWCKDCGKSPVLQRKKAISCQPSQLRRAFLEPLSLILQPQLIEYLRVVLTLD